MKKLIFIVFLFTGLFATAQDGNYDEFLARQFLQNGEFAKAAEYYEGLFKQNPAEYYDDYLDILVQLKDFEKVEKVIKTLYKNSGNNPVYLLDLGDLYLKQNKDADAEKQFNKTIKELKQDRYVIGQIAMKFIQLKQLDFAQRTYEKGKELLKDKNAYNLEIAHLFFLKNDLTGMINAYLNEAPYQANNLTLIENGLQKAMTDEKSKDALEKELTKLLIPKDPQDDKNAVLEIRAGTGGDEASLFAGDLLNMYLRYCGRKGWKTAIVSESEGTVGGYKEVVVEVQGEDVYGSVIPNRE